MIQRRLLVLTIGALALCGSGAFVFACTGDDPALVSSNPDGATPSPTNEGGSPSEDSSPSTTPDSSKTTPVPTEIHASCPRPTLIACGDDPPYGAPQLHLDACTLGLAERRVVEWVGRSTGGSPAQTVRNEPAGVGSVPNGALLCLGALNGRPGLQFSQSQSSVDGFTLRDANVLNYNLVGGAEGSFVWVAVTSYTGGGMGSGEMIMQRATDNQAGGFAGPALVANLIYADVAGTTQIDEANSRKGIGVQLRFGPKAGLDASRAVVAATESHRVGPLVVVARKMGSMLELRINGKHETGTTVPAGLTDGANRPMTIGWSEGTGNAFFGVISELLFYTQALDMSAVIALENGLLAKWGIAKAQ